MSINIYQISYSKDVAASVGDFLLYDCTGAPAWDKREIFHMHKFYNEGRHLDSELSGLVSPKFSAKTKIAGKRFIEFIQGNPGYDVYFINPFPHLAYLSFNVWEQGEFWHRDLCRLANALFKAAEFDLDVTRLSRNKAETLLYSNYWVGNHAFWDRFMTVVGRLMDAVDTLPETDRAQFFSLAAHSTAATYYPFVFERIFSTFLLMETGIKFLAYPWSRSEVLERCETKAELLIVNEWANMIDQWDDAGTYSSDQRLIFATLMKISRSTPSPASSKSSKSLLRKLLSR